MGRLILAPQLYRQDPTLAQQDPSWVLGLLAHTLLLAALVSYLFAPLDQLASGLWLLNIVHRVKHQHSKSPPGHWDCWLIHQWLPHIKTGLAHWFQL